jgi:hypothetical protein
MENTKFYGNKKMYISPSALSSWHNNQSSFVSHYFGGETSPETSAMKAGKKLHALIEGGFLKGHRRFEMNEKTLEHPSPVEGVNVLGKPDSFGLDQEIDMGFFTDYKTGKEVSWTREDLASDLKMRTTAWLVWKELGKPKAVTGYIVWIGTEWNGEELIASEDEYLIIKYVYFAEELIAFEQVIEKTINEVNEAYPRFLNPTDNVSEELCNEYAGVYKQIKDIENGEIAELKEKLSEIGETIADQMRFGLSENHKLDIGTFFWKSTKKYEYPQDMKFQTEDGMTLSFAKGDEITSALKVAKKNFEKYTDPVSENKFLQFRAKK